MSNVNYPIYFILSVAVFFLLTTDLQAQHTNDDFKRNLRKSLRPPEKVDIKPELKYQPYQIKQSDSEVLKVSPTTKLPTQFDRVELEEPIPPVEKLQIDLTVTNVDNTSQPGRAAIDYSDGKVHAIPDVRSISQSIQYVRSDYGLGIYADDSYADWIKKLRKKTTPKYRDLDLDPVRYFQRLKAAKRKEKVDKIKKVYNQE